MEGVPSSPAPPPPQSFFEAAGGEQTFRRLVAEFYRGVAADPPLRALYPDEDLSAAQQRLTLFLIQYWGGPRDYQALRGHPRLRMRHAPFPIDAEMRGRWLRHMRAAVDSLQLAPALRTQLWDYLESTAHFLTNREDPPPGRVLPTL